MRRWIACIGFIITGTATFLLSHTNARYAGLFVVAIGVYFGVMAIWLKRANKVKRGSD